MEFTEVMEVKSGFTSDERATLHSLAEMFQEKDDRDELRRLINEGHTIREIILAFRLNRRVITLAKATGGMIVLAAAVWGVLRSLVGAPPP